MKNKKGFTLIELLAVIVILAIIALIATPIVLNMINSARKSAAKSSTLGFIDSIEYYTGFAQASSRDMELGYDNSKVPYGVTCKSSENNCEAFIKELKTKTKGKIPDTYEFTISTSGKVEAGSKFTYNDYEVEYTDGDALVGGTTSNPIESKKEYVIVTDVDSNGVADIGDEIKIGSEYFYVISTDDEKINALAKYNLMVGNLCPSLNSCTPIENSTGMQDENMTGYKDGKYGNGSISFSNSVNWKAGETGVEKKAIGTLKTALDNYEIEMKKVASSASIRLATKTEIENLLNSREFTWLYSTSYWTGSVYHLDNYGIWSVSTNGKFYYVSFSDVISLGIRPVITINK